MSIYVSWKQSTINTSDKKVWEISFCAKVLETDFKDKTIVRAISA